MTRKPIIYKGHIDIRSSDIDLYGHVNSKHYIDIVSTIRLNFMEQEMKMPMEKITQKGLGFFMTKSTVNYRKPINGLQRVLVRSYISEVKNQKFMFIPFEICTEDGEKVFSDGVLEFALVDLKSHKTLSEDPPEWLLDLFFEK